jgi:tetratricopeptide (TPR) repeat protein
MSSGKTFWNVSVATLLILIGASLATIFMGGKIRWEDAGAKQTDDSGTLVLEKRLELYEKHADELEKVLSFLLGLTALYGIALGINAYQQAKDSSDRTNEITKRAERSVEHWQADLTVLKNDAKQDVEKFLNTMRGTFPVFGNMDHSIRDIMFRLTRLLPVLDWSERNYKNLNNQEKEEILFYEKTVASFEYFDLGTLREPASEIHHGLGNFYGLKFLTDGRHAEDWERSVFYLGRAIRQNRHNIGALNDRAMLAVSYDDPDRRPADLESYKIAEARNYFNQSLGVDPDQQRPRYNLAIFLHVEKKYKEAADMLTEALEKGRWQERPVLARRVDLLYNRACAWCRNADSVSSVSQRPSLLAKAWGDLDEAFRSGIEDLTSVKNDLKPGGDLRALVEDETYRTRIQDLMKAINA